MDAREDEEATAYYHQKYYKKETRDRTNLSGFIMRFTELKIMI